MSDARPEERPSEESLSSEPDETLSEHDQTLSDRDQTFSDRDQTFSDSDQDGSDADQAASDADQAASDADHADGHDKAGYERTAFVRHQRSRERLATAGRRDLSSSEREAVARERDDLAARRDRAAGIRDEELRSLELSEEMFDKHTLGVLELRSRASEARKRAADDRERARRDREQAARDRELAARDREQAAHERRLAGTDELTGARRRGVGLEELQREVERAQRTGSNLIAVYVDVDGLKQVNDGLGHSAGDKLLCEVAESLMRHVRSYDLVVRLGGDEFVCALPDVSLDEAHGRFDRLNEELRDSSARGSVSAGFALLQEGESLAELVDRADHDLLASRHR
jgi:diguanylate cyclase (GGDEF)-like protein